MVLRTEDAKRRTVKGLMPSSADVHSQVCGPPAEYDARRTLEFYRYYEAFETLSDAPPLWVDLHDANATTQHRPASSPDKALTAFCQLIAIQLGVERALVMFFDGVQGYVLAEATKSTLLQKNAVVGSGEKLWLGHSTIPKGFAVCEHTTNLPVNQGSNRHDPSAAQVHIINDLEGDVRFRNRPYVTDGPRARFYAGAPITTPLGINIGAVCALDNQPRDGLTESEIDFLIDIATTITQHLEATRARAEKNRGNKMAAGLSAYLQGMSMKVCKPDLSTGRTSEEQAKDSDIRNRLSGPSYAPLRASDRSSPSLEETVPVSRLKVSEHVPAVEAWNSSIEPTPIHNTKRSDRDASQPFALAASIIQTALDVDGVLFIDASVSSFGGLVGDADQNTGMAARRSSSFEAFDEFSWTDRGPARNGDCSAKQAVCGILGEAYKDEKRGLGAREHRSITERFFRYLLRTYPKGKIWAFDADGALAVPQNNLHIDVDFARSGTLPPLASRDSQLLASLQECEILIKCFPGVRSLALLPMWDHSAERWVAGTLLYTYSPIRTFSYEGDMNFMTVFNDVILAELARSQTEATLQAKTAFVASITHELRTPLHGIMGTVEHLQDEFSSPFASKLLAQIDTCGKVLLEMIDNLLALSAMSNQSTNRNHASDASQSDRIQNSFGQPHPKLSNVSAVVDVALDDATEQAVEALAYSYSCSYSRQEVKDTAVSIIIDIDQRSSQSWRLYLPTGAWERVCLNLVDNALKFTTKGYVLISLKQQHPINPARNPHVLLTIEDTGCGMSNDFLANSLFRDFSQADPFVNGMGLGLNVAAKIVNSLGGTIDVQSTQGSGTKVTVLVPLEPVSKYLREGIQDCETKTGHAFKGVGVCVFDTWNRGLQPCEERGQRLLRVTLEKSLEQLGISVNRGNGSCGAGSLNLVFESDLSSLLFRIEQARTAKDENILHGLSLKPIIVICKSYFSARILETTAREGGLGAIAVVEYLAEPCGPVRLAAAVRSCLERAEALERRMVGPEFAMATLKRELAIKKEGAVVLPTVEPSSYVPSFERCEPSVTPRRHKSGQMQNHGNISPVSHKHAHTKGAALSVMLVDDNSINLQLLETFCRKRGHRSMVATDGVQAVRLYETASVAEVDSGVDDKTGIDGKEYVNGSKSPPDVILMDINMPIMNGFEATRRIRSMEKATGRSHRALIIAITGVGSAEARQQAHASGMDLFFQKPVKLKELTKVLEEHFPKEPG